jgi:hypothetical protein
VGRELNDPNKGSDTPHVKHFTPLIPYTLQDNIKEPVLINEEPAGVSSQCMDERKEHRPFEYVEEWLGCHDEFC